MSVGRSDPEQVHPVAGPRFFSTAPGNDAVTRSHPEPLGAGLPPELRDELQVAAERVEDLAAQGRELHCALDESKCRIVVEVRDLDGTVLRVMSCSEALGVMAGAALR